jgi:hypothetical protein
MSSNEHSAQYESTERSEHASEGYHEQCQQLISSGFMVNDDLNKFWLNKHDGDVHKTLVSLHDVIQYYM